MNPKNDIYVAVGRCIRDLRMSYGGKGISQADLARAVNTTPNTISRWEAGVYKPTLANIDALASFFGVPISRMFPHAELSKSVSSLLSAADGLDEADLEELTRFALFKRATNTRPKTHSANNRSLLPRG